MQTTCCSLGSEVKSVWEEFEKNGHETELDELNRLFRGLDVGDVLLVGDLYVYVL